MNNVEKTIEALKQAEIYLDTESCDPKKYNDPMSMALEVMSWDISNMISMLKENSYLYG